MGAIRNSAAYNRYCREMYTLFNIRNINLPGEKVDIIGISKGHGFQVGVRRHHFAGGPKSHGQSDRLRAPGSIGGSSFPSHTWKGQKMAGRMGGEQVTTKNLQIVDVDVQKNLLLIKGAVPGKKNSLVTVKKIKTRTL